MHNVCIKRASRQSAIERVGIQREECRRSRARIERASEEVSKQQDSLTHSLTHSLCVPNKFVFL